MPRKNKIFDELESARAKLSTVEADLNKNQTRQAEIRKNQSDREAGRTNLVIRAQSYLCGEPDFSEQITSELQQLQKLYAQEKILREAVRLQQETVDKFARDVALELRNQKHGAFCTIQQAKVDAITGYYQAFQAEAELRKIFAENGLPDAWPTICWPGMRQTNFEREAQALAHHLEQTGLSKNVKINLKT